MAKGSQPHPTSGLLVDSPFRKSLTWEWFLPSWGYRDQGRAGQGVGSDRTCCQCRSFIPGLQEMLRIGMCCLNLSIFIFTFSAKRLGAGMSAKVLVNLYIVLHIFPISSAISSAFSKKRGPRIKKTNGGKVNPPSRCQPHAPLIP